MREEFDTNLQYDPEYGSEHCYECGSEEVGVYSSSGDKWCMPCYFRLKREKDQRKAAQKTLDSRTA